MTTSLDLPTLGQVLRTPDSQFANLHDFPYVPQYLQIGGLRIAYIDEGPRDARVVLLMHGEPTWSYLYRKMIPVLLDAGYRVVAPDLVGFGRSDKPMSPAAYTYRNHVAWMAHWLEAIDLQQAALFCQDWGSLIGLRLVAHAPDRFSHVILGNGGLPTGNDVVPGAFKWWQRFARWSPLFPIGQIVKSGCAQGLAPTALAAYNAPFPDSRYKVGARVFPSLVPTTPNDPERAANEAAWEMFKQWQKPFLTLFSTRDPITKGGEKIWQKMVPGAQGQAHAQIRGAGHFLQEDKGPEVAQLIAQFVAGTSAS